MKKFFCRNCIYNAGGLSAFVVVSLYLLIAWRLISSDFLVLQISGVLWVVYFVCSALIGGVIILIDFIRTLIAKRKNDSAPTEVSAE